ncbi:MAG: cupin domain-containing protein [Ideonella sp.]
MALEHAASGDIIDVRPLGAALHDHVSTAFFKSAQLELMHLVLPSGQALPDHTVPGEITLQCIEGLIEFATPTVTRQLSAGQLIHLAGGEPHRVLALTDSTALLTICLIQR